jgi:hypothetical protein
MPMLFFVHDSICRSSFSKSHNHRRFEGPFVRRLRGGHKIIAVDEILLNTSTEQVDELMDVDEALEEVTSLESSNRAYYRSAPPPSATAPCRMTILSVGGL